MCVWVPEPAIRLPGGGGARASGVAPGSRGKGDMCDACRRRGGRPEAPDHICFSAYFITSHLHNCCRRCRPLLQTSQPKGQSAGIICRYEMLSAAFGSAASAFPFVHSMSC